MSEILDGKLACKVTVEELSRALNVSEPEVARIVKQLDARKKSSIYIRTPMVKRLVSKIRTSAASEATANHAEQRKGQKRIDDNTRIEKARPRLEATKLKWKLLPKGDYPFQRIEKHFQELSRRLTQHVVDTTRLRKINNLGPDKIYVGIDEFAGYVGFRFGQRTVFDCPVVDNAIYIFGENWQTLCRRTKAELLNGRRSEFKRIVHRGDWFKRLELSLHLAERSQN